MEDAKEAKYIQMTTEPVEKLILRLAVPTMISMMVTALYNMADTFFVGRLGTSATAGVGLIFPLMSIMQAFGYFFGQGSGNYISRSLGAKRMTESERMVATGFFSSLLLGLLILGGGLLFKSPLLYVLGATTQKVSAATVENAGAYMSLILIGAPFICASCVLNNQLRFQGNALFSMIGLVSGAVLNIALDPLFIFVFHWGVTGAAAATVLSQFLSFCLLFSGTLKSDSLKIRFKNFRPTWFYYKNICVGGLPSLFRQGFNSLSTLCLNAAAASAVPVESADAAIAAFSVVGKIMVFAFSAVLGFGQGFQPVCGYNYGAKQYDRVRRGFLFCIRVAFIVLLCVSAGGFLLADRAVALFRDDPAVISMGAIALRCQCCTFPLLAVVVPGNMLFQNMGKMVRATWLAVSRHGLYFIPAVLLLPLLIEPAIWGVYLAQPVADIVSFLTAVPLSIAMCRRLKKGAADPEGLFIP